jgi:hypothetical protein
MRTTPSRTAAPAKPARAKTVAAPAKTPDPAPMATWKDDPEKRDVMIRLAAYTFYERRGFVSGHELEDWLQAEMEVDRHLAAEPKPDEAT